MTVSKNLFLLLFFALIACTKESQIIDLDVAPVVAKRLLKENPLEYLGVEHNKMLDEVSAAEKFDSFSQKDIYDYVEKQTNYESKTPTSWEEFQPTLTFAKELIFSNKEMAAHLVKLGVIRKENLALAEELQSIFLQAANLEKETFLSTQEFKAKIEALEQQILHKYSPKIKGDRGNDVALILGACAVAKHSYAYWLSVATDKKSPWYNRLEGDDQKKIFAGIWRCIKRAAVDVGAFFSSGCHDGYEFSIPCANDAAKKASAAVK